MRTALACLAALLLLTSCAKPARIFSDGGEIPDLVPRPARTECEQVFRSELMSNLGKAMTPLPQIRDSSLVAVLNACSADELVDANDYYEFAAGPSMGRLLVRRLLTGRDRDDELDRLRDLCKRPFLTETNACETLGDA